MASWQDATRALDTLVADRQARWPRGGVFSGGPAADQLLPAAEPTGKLDPHISAAVFENLYKLARAESVATLGPPTIWSSPGIWTGAAAEGVEGGNDAAGNVLRTVAENIECAFRGVRPFRIQPVRDNRRHPRVRRAFN